MRKTPLTTPPPYNHQHEEKRIGCLIFIQNHDLKLTEILQILLQKVLILEQEGPNLDRVKILCKKIIFILKILMMAEIPEA